MNLLNRFEELNVDECLLTDKKQQTDYKIKYVHEYVKVWTIVNVNRKDIDEITFIDCMCNAGVYKDGDCCTAIEVLNEFVNYAKQFKNKKFNLYLNDYNPQSVELIKKTVELVCPEPLDNLNISFSCQDVNVYLEQLSNNREVFKYGNVVLLYVDPYDFGTVDILKIKNILERHYCEVIFNLFISDYVRNIGNDKNRIKKCIGGLDISTKEDLISFIQTQFRVGKIKYLFAYQFKTKTNQELYQIVFVTPNKVGLEKLKEVLWKVFDGKEFHRNFDETEQLSLFTENDEKELRVKSYAVEAKALVCDYLKVERTYEEIEIFLIENTMLRNGQIINYVIRPLIDEKKIIRTECKSPRNYTNAKYKGL